MNSIPSGIQKMPPEVTEKIFSYLPDHDLINCTFYICRRWREIATCNKLWRERKFCVRDSSLGRHLANLLWDTALLRFLCIKKSHSFRAKYSSGSLVLNKGPIVSSTELSLSEFKECLFMDYVKSIKMEDDVFVMCLGEPADRPRPLQTAISTPKRSPRDNSSVVKPAEHKNCLFEGSVSGTKVGDVVVVTRIGPPAQSVYNPGPAPIRSPEVHNVNIDDGNGSLAGALATYCGFGNDALTTVCRCCPALESLDLWGLQLSDNVLRLVGLCKQLTAFRMAKCSGVTGLGLLSRCRKLAHITIDTCPNLKPTALHQILQICDLEVIELYECDLSGFPFTQIVTSLPQLSSLTLVNCKGFSQKDLTLLGQEDLDLTIEFAQNADDH